MVKTRSAWGRAVRAGRWYKQMHLWPASMKHAVYNTAIWSLVSFGCVANICLSLANGRLENVLASAVVGMFDFAMLWLAFQGLLYRRAIARDRKAFEAIAITFEY